MANFKFRVSVIVPVYKVEKYLRECIDSLLMQTIDEGEMEILLINDGSPDNSLEICEEYAALYDFIKVFSKENEGLSATRNFGIRNANGKYLMYLDSDDSFSPEVVKNCADFFDKHYEEIDIVTYKEQAYRYGDKLPLHFRYQYFKETGVYDLYEYPYIIQTRINICVKNVKENNIFFIEDVVVSQEDQEYNSLILKDKMKIGYVNKGEYRYRKDNDTSIMATKFNPILLFEIATTFFENMFVQFNGAVPAYYQTMLIHDLNWKIGGNKLFPYHYEKEEFDVAVNRVKNLLSMVDADTILNFPACTIFMKHYLLSLKPNLNAAFFADTKEFSLIANGESLYNRDFMEMILHRMRIENGRIHMIAFAKSPVYNYVDGNLYAVVNGDFENRIKLETFLSSHGYFETFTSISRFQGFHFEIDLYGDSGDNSETKIKSLQIEAEFDGCFYPGKAYWYMPLSVFDRKSNRMSFISEDVRITFKDNAFYFEKCFDPYNEKLKDNLINKSTNLNVFMLRQNAIHLSERKKIWLYSDLYTVMFDNGYWQFLHDFEKDDGVERYYIYTKPLDEIRHLFEEKHLKYLIEWKSDKHKLYYLAAEYIFSAFFGISPVSPFNGSAEETLYTDIKHSKVVYLQHGVLHADFRTKNDAEKCSVDKIVVSSQMEYDVYKSIYHYRDCDIIPTGMARYDNIKAKKTKSKKILYAPSWRNYFTTSPTPSEWVLKSEAFTKSSYYTKITDFLQSEILAEILKRYDFTLHFKPHPILLNNNAHSLFDIESDRIHIIQGDVNEGDYRVFITDISSYVFDFVYLKRAILYFMPDMDEFKCGMNHYRQLHLPLEEGFGELTEDPEAAVAALEKILSNNCVPEEKFRKRMNEFFLPMGDNCERLYQALIKKPEEFNEFIEQ